VLPTVHSRTLTGPLPTLRDFAGLLAPYLPDGFVPKNLPFSTLQRIKSRKRGHHSRTKN
jgi:hypothetical protein